MSAYHRIPLGSATACLVGQNCQVTDIATDGEGSVLHLTCNGVKYLIPLSELGIAREVGK